MLRSQKRSTLPVAIVLALVAAPLVLVAGRPDAALSIARAVFPYAVSLDPEYVTEPHS